MGSAACGASVLEAEASWYIEAKVIDGNRDVSSDPIERDVFLLSELIPVVVLV